MYTWSDAINSSATRQWTLLCYILSRSFYTASHYVFSPILTQGFVLVPALQQFWTLRYSSAQCLTLLPHHLFSFPLFLPHPALHHVTHVTSRSVRHSFSDSAISDYYNPPPLYSHPFPHWRPMGGDQLNIFRQPRLSSQHESGIVYVNMQEQLVPLAEAALRLYWP